MTKVVRAAVFFSCGVVWCGVVAMGPFWILQAFTLWHFGWHVVERSEHGMRLGVRLNTSRLVGDNVDALGEVAMAPRCFDLMDGMTLVYGTC